jgi:peptidyl-lysine (3S)-dioxygenase / protease
MSFADSMCILSFQHIPYSTIFNILTLPYRNADSIVELDDDDLLFIKPYETSQPFETVMQKIQEQELHPQGSNGTPPFSSPSPNSHKILEPTLYAQTQNDNLRSEYSPLAAEIPPSVPFAHIALSKPPDAINFWLGNSRSVTALHKDNYENIYVQMLGKKNFVLLPPVEMPCVNEQRVLGATYVPRGDDEGEESWRDLVIAVDEPEEVVPFATWDPDTPEVRGTRFSGLSQPLRVTLDEGDMLYLPSLW